MVPAHLGHLGGAGERLPIPLHSDEPKLGRPQGFLRLHPGQILVVDRHLLRGAPTALSRAGNGVGVGVGVKVLAFSHRPRPQRRRAKASKASKRKEKAAPDEHIDGRLGV